MKQTLILISAFLLTASAYPQNTFSHQYDTLGRIVEVIYPNGKKINYSYDKLGNRLTKIQSPCYLPDAPGSINGSQSGCKSASQVYSVNTIPNTSSYQWTLPQGSSGSSTSNSIILFFGPDAITDTLFVQGQNSCGFGEKSFTVIEVKSIPLLPSPILGPSSVCAGQEPVSFSIPSMENVSGYQWVLPDGFSGSSTNNQIDLVISPVATSGWIRVKGLNECGEGQERAKFVTVNPLPMANAGADLTINHGTSTLLSGSASGGSDNYSYSWTPASLLVNSNIQSPHTLNLYQTTTFSLEVTDVATGCTGLADQVTVNITGSPLAAIPSANPSLICTGQSTQLFANATGGSGTYSYSWISMPAGFSSAAANPVVSPSANTNYFLTVDDGYNQVTGSLPITVKTIPSASGPIAGTSTVMAEDIGVSYSVPPVPGATSYEWGYTGQGVVIHGDQNSITIDFQATAISGNLRVRAINECGQGLFSADFPIQVEYVCRPHWQVAGSFPYHMNLIAKLYFDNVLSTNPYDSVAAFIDGECRGRSSRDIVDPGTLYINIGSYTVLPDTVRLKAWNSTTCEELDIYEAFPFSVTTLGDPTPVSLHTGWHETKIPLYNGWNWFSVNVNPGSMDINKLLSSVIADNTSQVKGPSQFATYNGVKWTGALKTLDPRQMYMLKVTVAQTLRLAGIPVTNIPVNLSSGWTWIGYIPQSVLAVNIALDSIYPSPAANSIIKDQAKFAKYAANKWTGALSALNPGKGYKLQLTQASTLLYPSPAKSGSGSSVPYTEPLPSNLPLSWKAVCDKEFNLTLLCKVKLDLESFSNDPDDVIAAFVGNECRGFATPDKENPGIYFLSVNSDVPSLETIRFRYLSGAKSDIAEVYQHLRYENTEDMGTLNNPVILTLASPMSIEENEMAGQNFLGENYPDPFGESTTIPFGLAKKASVSLKVFDMLGREVISLLEEEMKPGLQQVTADKQQLGRGIYYYRIEVVTDNERFVETKRMVVE